MTGLWTCTLGRPGIAPITTSSMLGCMAAVMETESPSQERPDVIQRIWISGTGEAFWVTRTYGTTSGMVGSPSGAALVAWLGHLNYATEWGSLLAGCARFRVQVFSERTIGDSPVCSPCCRTRSLWKMFLRLTRIFPTARTGWRIA